MVEDGKPPDHRRRLCGLHARRGLLLDERKFRLLLRDIGRMRRSSEQFWPHVPQIGQRLLLVSNVRRIDRSPGCGRPRDRTGPKCWSTLSLPAAFVRHRE